MGIYPPTSAAGVSPRFGREPDANAFRLIWYALICRSPKELNVRNCLMTLMCSATISADPALTKSEEAVSPSEPGSHSARATVLHRTMIGTVSALRAASARATHLSWVSSLVAHLLVVVVGSLVYIVVEPILPETLLTSTIADDEDLPADLVEELPIELRQVTIAGTPIPTHPLFRQTRRLSQKR